MGPYELHDFFLYYVLRCGFAPGEDLPAGPAWPSSERLYRTTCCCKWLRNFYRRFFAQQFKRSCLPDGPKVGSVTLSPRGDWRMPSDACATLWLAELGAAQARGAVSHEEQKAFDQYPVCGGGAGHSGGAAGGALATTPPAEN